MSKVDAAKVRKIIAKTKPAKFVISGDHAKALRLAGSLDKLCKTRCTAAVSAHKTWQDGILAAEKSYGAEVSGFELPFAQVLDAMDKGKPYGPALKQARTQIDTIQRALGVVSQTLAKLQRARSDLVRQLAAVKKCLAKGGAKGGGDAPEKTQATAFEAELRTWAFSQVKGMDALAKDLPGRKKGISALSAIVEKIPRDQGTPV